MSTTPAPMLPPFCVLGGDALPTGPAPGSPESMALAAWEVLTGARVARGNGSGRMSLLGRYRAEAGELTTERIVWMTLHPFEGAVERWSCRLARGAAMTDRDLERAIVQEMGGPAEEPEEMTTLGFLRTDVGFYFDSRGPSVEITVRRDGRSRTRRLGRTRLLRAAREILGIQDRLAAPTSGTAPRARESSSADQLILL